MNHDSQTSKSRVPARRLVAAATLISLIGVLDYLTGIELRIYPLYMLPIAWVASSGSLAAGAVASLAATIAWLVSNGLAGLESPPVTWLVNSFAQLVAFNVVVVLVVNLQRSREAQTLLARVDELTGAWNSRAFNEFLAAELERTRRYQHPFGLAYMDLDHFKAVNDQLGHASGDAALQAVTKAIRSALRSTDVVARLGGDEFAILLPETPREMIAELLERARASVAEAMQENAWAITCSIGALSVDSADMTVEALVRQADALMYRVKQSGRDAVLVEAATSTS